MIPCQIGGYPFFTQYDPRQEDSNEILLFQLDSQDHILWGDSVSVTSLFQKKI